LIYNSIILSGIGTSGLELRLLSKDI
jgi:hypothetical protein